MIDFDTDLSLWNAVSIQIVDVKHGLLIKRRIAELFESSSLLFVQGINGKLQIEDTPYVLKSNHLFHICRNKRITIDACGGEIEYFAVAYQAELPPSAGREMTALLLQKSPFDRCLSVHMMNAVSISNRFINIADAWRQQSPLEHMHIKRQFYAIVHAFYQALVTARTASMEVDVFEKARQYLQSHFAQVNSLQLLADSLGVTRATLHKQFKRHLGLSPQQYVMRLRLELACAKLSDQRLSIDEIAVCCGLRDKSYFSRVFKQKFGLPPGAYRTKRISAGIQAPNAGVSASLPFSAEKSYTLIENFGRLHRYYGVPRRIVCLDYAAAELCAALGASDRLAGVASAESALTDCKRQYRKEIAAAPFLPGHSLGKNVPNYKAVCDCKPDLIVGTAYSFHERGGVAGAESFEKIGIHIYAMKATYTLESTFDDTYEDIQNLGRILGAEARAAELTGKMMRQEAMLRRMISEDRPPVRVFSFDMHTSDRAFTCGQSLESHIIAAAGGINIFSDRAQQYAAASWAEVAERNPQAILIHRFHDKSDGEQKLALLNRIAEIADTDAMRRGKILTLGIKKVFPGIDNVETALSLAKWLGRP